MPKADEEQGAKESLGTLLGPGYGTVEPSFQGRYTLFLAAGLICGVELCERLAFYTFNGSQPFFLVRLGYPLSSAAGINAAMWTLCMTLTVFSGWISDVLLGRYWSIVVFTMLYVIGTALCSWAGYPSQQSAGLYLTGVMVFVPLGTSGIKCLMSNFGADQFNIREPGQLEARERFFSYFYLAINVGAAIAYGWLTTLATSGGPGVPKNYGFFVVYLIAALAMSLALLMFIAGKPLYRILPVQKTSALGSTYRYLQAARRRGSSEAWYCMASVALMVIAIIMSLLEALAPGGGLYVAIGAFLCAVAGLSFALIACYRTTWVGEADLAGECLSASDMKDMLRLVPILIPAQLSFGALMNCMMFYYQHQACQMDVRAPWADPLDPHPRQLNGSIYNIADCLAIIVFTPIVVMLIIPAVERVRGSALGFGFRYTVGVSLGTASVLSAAILEMYRRSTPKLNHLSDCAPNGIRMSSMNAMWMLLPYALMGLGEVWAMPTMMHLAYNQAPPAARTFTSIMGFFFMGVSSALFSIFVILFSRWVPDNLNNGNLEYAYLANWSLAVLFLICFTMLWRQFEQKTFD